VIVVGWLHEDGVSMLRVSLIPSDATTMSNQNHGPTLNFSLHLFF
jgi:hypothetical protein